MEKQQLKLMDTIAAIVGTLDQRELFQPSSVIQDASTPTLEPNLYFTAFGEALIWNLQQQFGPAFTPEMEQAWIELYDAIQTENDACRKNASLARRLLVKVGRHDAHGRGRLLRDV